MWELAGGPRFGAACYMFHSTSLAPHRVGPTMRSNDAAASHGPRLSGVIYSRCEHIVWNLCRTICFVFAPSLRC